MSLDRFFEDVERAGIEHKRIVCRMKRTEGKTVWTVEITDPETERGFVLRMADLIEKLRSGGCDVKVFEGE